MKKILALAMVLSMPGLAGASLQLEVANGRAMVTGKLDNDLYLILSAGNGASLSNFALGKDAPSASIPEMLGTADDFRAAGVPVPDGFSGEGWFLGSFPGEPYKTGTQFQADVAVTTWQEETSRWEEKVTEGCMPGMWRIRTWIETTQWTKGSLSLNFLSGDFTQTGTIQNLSLDSQTVTTTFIDGICPEPATLTLLGLGFVLIRGRKPVS